MESTLSIVVGYDENFVIGKENELPWERQQKNDLRRVMQLTKFLQLNFPADERNKHAYSFITYLRNHPID